MRFLNKYYKFILEEYNPNKDTRSKPIYVENEKIVDVMKEKAPWYLGCVKDITPIYRGIVGHERYKNMKGDRYNNVFTVNPAKHDRHARNTESYYMDIMNISEEWDEYPNRKKSIICTTDWHKAKAYGVPYRVIPFRENSKFGICPSGDVFNSFEYLFKKLEEVGFDIQNPTNPVIPDFNYLLMNIGFPSDYEELGEEDMHMIFHNFIHQFEEYEDYWEEDWEYNDIIKGFAKKYINGHIHREDLMGMFQEWIAPDMNGFKLEKYNCSSVIKGNKEVWTDSECLLILETEFQEILDNI